jgi:hypothetical protein
MIMMRVDVKSGDWKYPRLRGPLEDLGTNLDNVNVPVGIVYYYR